jgi:large subunit ribosomal protein L15
MPLSQRVPKLRGFYNRFRVEYQVVNCGKLKRFDEGAVVDLAALHEAGLVRQAGLPVKLLAGGGSPPKLTVKVHRASASARAAVEAAGGSVELLDAEPAEPSDGGQVSAP